MRQYNRFFCVLEMIAIVPCEHINFSLVDAQLADVRLEEKNICALHDGIQILRHAQLITLVPPHNRHGLLNSGNVVLCRDVHYRLPVLIRVLVDFIGCPQELDILHFHAQRFPDFHKVETENADLAEVASHLVVQFGEPVGYPEHEDASAVH